MPARLKVYLDENCTQELYRNEKGSFFFRFRDSLPYVDGNTGAYKVLTLYLKNIGSRAALYPRILVPNKVPGSKSIYTSTEYRVGKDIPVDGVASIDISFSIPQWTASQVNETELIIDYYSLPDTTPEITPIKKHYVLQDETNYNIKQEGIAHE